MCVGQGWQIAVVAPGGTETRTAIVTASTIFFSAGMTRCVFHFISCSF